MSFLQQYHKHGYFVVEDLFSHAETSALQTRTAEIAEGRAADFPDGDVELEPGTAERSLATLRKINRCAENDPLFLAAAQNTRILDIVESLVGADVKLFGSQCFMKPPGGVEKPYHQDSAYFTIDPPRSLPVGSRWTM